MRRGEVWWAELPEPSGSRPVVLLTRDEGIKVRSLVTVAPVTTKIRGIASEIALGRDQGLQRECAANCDVITTIAKSVLSRRIGVLDDEGIEALDNALRFSLGIKERRKFLGEES